MKKLLSRLLGGSPEEATLYTLVEPAPASRLGVWAAWFPQFDQVVGYSALGHFFLRSSANNEYIVLQPMKQGAKSYGTFRTVAEFASVVLDEPGFKSYVLRPEHVAEVARHAGSRRPEEIYIPQPYPFAGGSDAPATYGKGDPWVAALVVAHMLGLQPPDNGGA